MTTCKNKDLTPFFHNATTVSYTYGDDLLSQTRNGTTNTYHYDGLGSTRALSDNTGAITDSYNYEAFGEVLSQTGITVNDYLFAGEQFDANLDQYYLRARYYDQGIGRFTQQDTWMGNSSDPVTLHKYLYGNADPVNFVDPSGNFSLGSVGSGLSVLSTLSSIATTSYDLFSASNNGQQLSAKEIGTALMISAVGGKSIKVVKVLAKKVCNKIKKCKVPILDVQHIFYGEFVKRTPKGFHSTRLYTRSRVDKVLWKHLNGVYKADVSIFSKNRYKKKKRGSTMFPDSWSKSFVAASLYSAWLRTGGKKRGDVNFGLTVIHYDVFQGLLRGYPIR